MTVSGTAQLQSTPSLDRTVRPLAPKSAMDVPMEAMVAPGVKTGGLPITLGYWKGSVSVTLNGLPRTGISSTLPAAVSSSRSSWATETSYVPCLGTE